MTTGPQNEFIEKVAYEALRLAPSYGIHVVSPIIAQAIIESNWGKSGLATKGRNLFGIKCGSSWKGASINMLTNEEYSAGTLTTIKDDFRMYNSWEDSIADYFEFINTKRYAALKECRTAQEYCEAIKAAGYATSSTYVKTLMDCIAKYDLLHYDDYVGIPIPAPAEVDVIQTNVEVPKQEPEPTASTIDYAKVVNDVINKVYGSGDDRIIRLAKNGYNPLAVQYMVNLQMKINELTTEREEYYNIVRKMKEVLK